MEQKTKDLINKAMGMFTQTTGMKGTLQPNGLRGRTGLPDGLVRIDHQDMHWDFAVEAKKRVNQAMVALLKTQTTRLEQDCILVTEYVPPPMADLMKKIGLFFVDTAGNAYVQKPPLYIFVKGNKPPEKVGPAPTKRLFKPAGLKVVFTLLNVPEQIALPYRQIAEMTGVALGTIDWIFSELKEMGFLLEMEKRKRTMANTGTLLRRWVEAYPDHLRPNLGVERFKADQINWWMDVDIKKYDACWGGEVAAAKITKQLKPEKVIIYAHDLPGKLIIEQKLRKTATGDIEILKPFWKFDHAFTGQGIVPPLLVYADLMATGDDRNIETAGIIYDKYLAQLAQLDRQAR